MAIIKAVNSRASIANAIRYITKDGKTEFDLVSGINCSPESAITQMKLTKALWGKTKGRQYKHFIQSFPKDEKITPEEAHQIATKLMERWDIAKGYEVIFATHIDKGHIHTHFILNSVSCENGRKFRYSKRDFSKFRELSDRILTEHNKSICEKNNEITTYNIGAYKAMQKALAGKYDSWLLAVALAVRAAKAAAKTKKEFISILSEKNISVTWNSRKYITFTDKDGHKVRNKKLTETFKEDFSKEGLENEFKRNSTAAIDQAERERQERELAEFYAEFMQREQDDEGETEELGDGIDEPEEEVSRKRTSHSYDAR